jgi:DNA-binding transcriptional regulator YdaS (Cro superfamily)
MDLTTYIDDMGRRRALADAIGTSAAYLWQIATGWRGRQVNADLAQQIEHATGGQVRCEELRPDLRWQRDQSGQITGFLTPLKPIKKAGKRAGRASHAA